MKRIVGGVALLIALASTASAQDGSDPLPPPTRGPVYYEPIPEPYPYCTGKRPGLIARLKDRFERHGCGYGSTHHDIGSIGIRAHGVFIFGNSWQFFEEPCNKQPRHPWFRK